MRLAQKIGLEGVKTNEAVSITLRIDASDETVPR
jgi:hypothetical protein